MPFHDFSTHSIPPSFFWFNPPANSFFDQGLHLITKPATDFWQTTHYGFQRDDGHCLLTRLTEDFSITTKTRFQPNSQYDQCGLMLRIDSKNWIKCSTEYEDANVSRLGSVVTNYGFSDWSTQDIASTVQAVRYRLSKRQQDVLIEYSLDGQKWHQMRVAHLHLPAKSVDVGIYACSPVGKGFQCQFDWIEIGANQWFYETAPS